MPARLSLTKAQRDALLLLPDTEEAFVRHYSLVAEDIEIISGYRTPETRLAFALQLCVLRYPGRVLRHGEIMPMHLLAFIAEQVGVSPDAIGGFARRPQTRYEHLAALRKRFGFSDLLSPLGWDHINLTATTSGRRPPMTPMACGLSTASRSRWQHRN
jgi:TnpA family transposase